MGAPLVFFDIAGSDRTALRGFYSELFGWDAAEDGQFEVVTSVPLKATIREDPPEKRLYIGVSDVAAVLEQVAAAGGSVDTARFEVPGVVVLGLFRDPAGNPLGLVEMDGDKPRIP